MAEYRKKLIEVALPLEEINAACKADKDRKTGTIRNMHKWFAPMPLPAWRALIYAALIDDPEDDGRRVYHLDLIKRLVRSGADTPDPEDILEARRNIESQYQGAPPALLDPFCGGGSTLLEARRLGLRGFGSDLNPIPVLISKSLVDVLPRVQDLDPLPHLPAHDKQAGSTLFETSCASVRAKGPFEQFIEDVNYFAELVQQRVLSRLSMLYPQRAGESTVAWLWARTAACPSPACGVESLLMTSWWISRKQGDLAWLEAQLRDGELKLSVISGQRTGGPSESPKTGRGATFACLACGAVLDEDYLIAEGIAGRIGLRMTCVVVDRDGTRIYREPTEEEIAAAGTSVVGEDFPNIVLPDIPRWFSPPRFGFREQADLYTSRQLSTHMAFADEVAGIYDEVIAAGGTDDRAKAITVLLGLSLGKLVQVASTLAIWRHQPTPKAEAALSTHAIPMMWDFPEVNVFGGSVGDWLGQVRTACRALPYIVIDDAPLGEVNKADARVSRLPEPGLVATDPPYFDAIGYADLSDYFYVWHRRALREVLPELYTTLAAPRLGELTAIPSHHGNSVHAARSYFISGFAETFRSLKTSLAPDLPMLIVYASKEQKGGDQEETRWASILAAMMMADLEITGTWPIRGTTQARMISAGTNAVASYVVMTARPRSSEAPTATLQELNRALRRELAPAIRDLQSAGTLPVDLPQASMGPGMQIYSRYRQVLDQTGNPVDVDQALRMINQARSEVLDEQEGELDSISRFACTWWERYGWEEGPFGVADQLARPFALSVAELLRAGVGYQPRPGIVLLRGSGELDRGWFPESDRTPTAWEAVHHLAERMIHGGGIEEAGLLMSRLAGLREQTQALAYRLDAISARRGWTKDQERYNALISSWSDLLAEAGRVHNGELF